jgi:chloramphenicol-sensitive protein RarD
VLAHRIAGRCGRRAAARRTRRLPQLKAACATARQPRGAPARRPLAVNWGTYIYGVTTRPVVETSLGYFINPIVTVLLGVLVLGERLRPAQWTALGLAGVAVLVLTVENGSPPWIALVLAFSFAFYGLLKKTAGVGAVEGLAIETGVLVPVAGVYLAVLGASGRATFGTLGAGHARARRALRPVHRRARCCCSARPPAGCRSRRSGCCSTSRPTLQFLLGITLFDEPLPPVKLLGFVLVWLGLALFTADLVRHSRADARGTPSPSPPDACLG